jgi:adenylate cyclase
VDDGERPLSRLGRLIREADRNEGLVKAVRAAASAAPGSPLPGDRPSDRVARLIAQAGGEQPSAVRELGLAAVQVWQALTSRGGRTGEITIAFTDLVGFSGWALAAGDDAVLELLRTVGRNTDLVVSRHGGTVVKSLGDGVMAVFGSPVTAVEAGCELCTAVSATVVDGYRPQLRVGLHTGRPRRVRDDYLGVDVNIAARVADAAGGGEVLVSGQALAGLDVERFVVRRRRRFRAKGTPKDLEVYSVVPKWPAGR